MLACNTRPEWIGWDEVAPLGKEFVTVNLEMIYARVSCGLLVDIYNSMDLTVAPIHYT